METIEPTLATARAHISSAKGGRERVRYKLAVAYSNFVGLKQWQGTYPDEATAVAAEFPGWSEKELKELSAVVMTFPGDVVARHGMDKLVLLLEYADATGVEPPEGDPSNVPIRVPVEGGEPVTRPFGECTVEDLQRAVRPTEAASAKTVEAPPAPIPVAASPQPARSGIEKKSPVAKEAMNRASWAVALVVATIRERPWLRRMAMTMGFGLATTASVYVTDGLTSLFERPARPTHVTAPVPAPHTETRRNPVTEVPHEETHRAIEPVREPSKPPKVEARVEATQAKQAEPRDEKPTKAVETEPAKPAEAPKGPPAKSNEAKPPKPPEPIPAAPAKRKTPTHPASPAAHKAVAANPSSTPAPESTTVEPARTVVEKPPELPKESFGIAAGEYKLREPAADSPKEWYAKSRGRQFGPPYLSPADIEQMCQGGLVDSESKVWRRGTNEWKPLKKDSVLGAIECRAIRRWER